MVNREPIPQPEQSGNPDLDALNNELDGLPGSFPELSPSGADVLPDPNENAADPNPNTGPAPTESAYSDPDADFDAGADVNPAPATPATPPAPVSPDRPPLSPLRAPEVEPPQVDPAAASAAGAVAVGTSVAGADGERRGNFWSRLVGTDGIVGRQSQRAKARRGATPDTAASSPANPDTEATDDAQSPATPSPGRSNRASTSSDNDKSDGLIGRRSRRAQGRRGRKAPDSLAPAPENADPDPGNPDTPAQAEPDRAQNPEPDTTNDNSGGLIGRRSRRGRGRRAPAPPEANNDPADPDESTPPTPTPRPATPPATPPVPNPATPPRAEKARSLLTPAGMASWIAVKTMMLTGDIKDRLQLEQENPKTMKWINIGAAALVGTRVVWGLYASYRGFGSGQVNTEAMQMVAETAQAGAQPGEFTDAAIDAASLNMEPVAFERPIDDTIEGTGKPSAVDPSDLAPAPVELGEWGGKANPSEGTVWGTTMDYLQNMGYDTDKLSDTQKYNLVDEVLKQNNLSWDEATRLSSDFEVKLPSANAMEALMDKHEIAHGELAPTVEAPETDPGTGTDEGDRSPDGSDQQNGEQPGATPTPTPTEPAPSTSATPSTPASPSPSVTPDTDHTHHASGNWGAVGDEALETLWQSAALYASPSLAGFGLAAKEAKGAPATPRRRAPRRRPGDRGPQNRNNSGRP